MNTAWHTFQRSVRMTRRAYPWSYFVATVMQGAITILLAYAVYHGVGGGQVSADFVAHSDTSDYVGYVAVGAVAYTFTMRMLLWTAKALITEEREGTIVALAVAPARRMPYLVGFVLFSFVSTLAEVATLCAVAALLGVRLPALDPLGLLVAVPVFTAAVFGLALVLSAVMLFAGEAHISQNTTFLLLAVFSGFTFPRSYLPGVAQLVGEVFPVTAALGVVRSVLDGRFDLGSAAPQILLALGVTAVYVAAGVYLLPRAEQRAIERAM